MYEFPSPPESHQSANLEQRTRVAHKVGPVAVWSALSAPFRRAWNRARGHDQSSTEGLTGPGEQWAEDAATQEGFRREEAPYLAYDYLRNRYRIPDASEPQLPASASRDLATLEYTELREDKREGITWLHQTDPHQLFTANGMFAAYTAARLEAGVMPSQYLRMRRKERQRLDSSVFKRARALHGAFIHDVELAKAFDAYIDYLTPQLSPGRRRKIETSDRVLPWVLVQRGKWWAKGDSSASEYKR